jgi:hypothetical protein
MRRKNPRPTVVQSNWLRRIALSPMMVTRIPGEPARYSLTDGARINEGTARALIRNGWLRPSSDGLFGDSQTFHAKGTRDGW